MKPAALITTILIITLGIIDLGFVVFGGTDGSVSQFLVNMGFGHPFITFTFGYVAGHLFGNMHPNNA